MAHAGMHGQAGRGPRVVVLVEGESDAIALTAAAARLGRDLDADGVLIEAIGGATSIGRAVDRWGPAGAGVQLAGLCDAGEVRHYVRALARAGLLGGGGDSGGGGGSDVARAATARLAAAGFGVCDADLEDELIRALGPERVLAVLEAEGDLRAFRTLQHQPAQQGRPVQQQLRRFMGTRSGRKAAAARALVDALRPDEIPAPLRVVLDALRSDG